MLLRFYKGGISLEQIGNMTPGQLELFLRQIPKVTRLETGGQNEPHYLTGEAAHKVAMRKYGKKKNG